jgi:hypothetical protein
MSRSRALVAFLLWITILHFTSGSIAQGPTSATAHKDFLDITAAKFSVLSDFRARLDLGKIASVSVVPTKTPPATNLQTLDSGTLIGAIYTPTGLTRLKLMPGAYAVRAVRQANQWFASFADSTGRDVGQARARVQSAPAVTEPFATLEESICWRFDEALFCI